MAFEGVWLETRGM